MTNLINELTEKIEKWATDRDLHTADPHKQMLKLIEEFGEIASGLARGDAAEVKDGIGDLKVVATILKEQLRKDNHVCIDKQNAVMLCLMIDIGKLAGHILFTKTPNKAFACIDSIEEGLVVLAEESGTDIEECTAIAWDEIKDRKGKMVNGVFVKEADLN
ncbi:MazG-like family protein [Sporosarcina sp. A2]|uniref:MazG-like family protein n=1 Tax=Sporosarcina sp. A2 TaxID=3393449 RepID=UPI003D7934D2